MSGRRLEVFIHRHHNHHTTAQTLVSWNCKSFEGDGTALIHCSRLIEEGYTKSKSGKTFFANHLLGFSRRCFFLSSGKHNRFELLRFSSVVSLKFLVLFGHSLIVSNKKLLCRFSPLHYVQFVKYIFPRNRTSSNLS